MGRVSGVCGIVVCLKSINELCILGHFTCFLSSAEFFKLILFSRNTFRVANSMYPVQARSNLPNSVFPWRSSFPLREGCPLGDATVGEFEDRLPLGDGTVGEF